MKYKVLVLYLSRLIEHRICCRFLSAFRTTTTSLFQYKNSKKAKNPYKITLPLLKASYKSATKGMTISSRRL